MRILVIALISLLVASSFATEQEDAQLLRQLQDIENSEFGSTLLDTIELQMMSEGPAEDLIALLQNIEKNMNKEQDEDNDFINKVQAECDQNLEKLDSEIKAAKERVAELQGEIDFKTPIRNEKEKQRRDKNEFKNMLDEKIADLDRRKGLRDQEWQQTQEEHDKASYIIQKAKEVIVASLSSGSFLQKDNKNVFAQVSEHFANHAKKYQFKQKSWNGIFNLLAQITAKAPVQANQDLVKRVLEICDDLLNKIAESREIERRDYQHWVQEYQTTRDQVSNKLSEIVAQIANLDSEIATLNKRINAATQERDEQKERIKQKSIQYEEKLQYCEDENKNYAKRREKRDADRTVVSQTIGLLQANLRLFRKYIADRQKNIKKKNF